MNAAELAKLIKAHNEAHPQRKVSQYSAREAYRRGVAEFTDKVSIGTVPTPVQGASPHACGERRLAEFLRVSAGDSAPTCFGDVDLLAHDHPVRRAAEGDADPWAKLARKEAETLDAAAMVLSAVTRPRCRKLDDRALLDEHEHVVRVWRSSSDDDARRTLAAVAAAAAEDEMARRGLLSPPPEEDEDARALYDEATKLRARPVRHAKIGGAAETPRGTWLNLGEPYGAVLLANRVPGHAAVDLKTAAETWSPDGSRYHYELRWPAQVKYAAAASYPAFYGEHQNIAEARVLVERGAEVDGSVELFLSGSRVAGTFVLRGDFASYASDDVPYVLSSEAVEKSWMPADGESALPASLEADVPPGMRYWRAAVGVDARSVRDALVATGFAQKIAVVDGEHHAVVSKIYLADASCTAEEELEFAKLGADSSIFSHVSIASAAEAESVAAKGAPYVVVVPDDMRDEDDGLMERMREQYGRPFRLAGGRATYVPSDARVARYLAASGVAVEWQTHAGLDDAAAQRIASAAKPMETQTLIFSRDAGWTAQRAKDWAKAHGFSFGNVDETSTSFRLRQADPGGFNPESFRTIALQGVDGVSMVVGQKKMSRPATSPSPAAATAAASSPVEKSKNVRVVRAQDAATAEERYVLGVVLEPETTDDQGDIYSAEEVRQAAHEYMLRYQQTGLMHTLNASPHVRVVESFVAPCALKVGEFDVKAGTWLVGVKILTDKLWQAVKNKEVNGFSMGGSAISSPVEDGSG